MNRKRKITYIKATTVEDARQQISELIVDTYQIGDQIIVTYPDDAKCVFSFHDMGQVHEDYVITPDGV